ncbi:MAG TPA: ATP-binding protein [Casimicrobiaceae bacterium]|nr:ATP-binding protein [Casimicrobiaceae bacterium]
MRRTARRSIRSELLVVLLVAVAGAWIATAVVSYLDARHELDELLDAHLAQTASLLMTQVGHEGGEIDVEHSPQVHRYSRRVAFQFWEGGTTLRLHSQNAPNGLLSPTLEGFSDAEAGGASWRVFGSWDPEHRYLVQVGERRNAREEIVAKIAKNMLWPLLLALPALGVLIWLGIYRATRPLRRLHGEVARRAPDNLAALDPGDAPAEVAPLVASLNALFDRVRASIENERRFTADAAHELRTPLAALRAQAQVARGAPDEAERVRALDNVIAGCDRASHLVDQLLTLARLEPEGFRAERGPCDLAGVTRLAVAEIAPAAISRSIDVDLAAPAPVSVIGDARLLAILLRNLLDNAVRYGRPGTKVNAQVGVRDGHPFVAVADDGPGVGADELAKLGRRFHRVLGTEASGTGLGLSIVERIARLHGATVSFAETSPGAGLTVTVTFG